MKIVILATLVSLNLNSVAAVKNSVMKPSKVIAGQGTKAGGLAGAGFMLLDIKSNLNREAQIERFLFDIGDLDGRANKGFPGYFQVELRNNSKTVVIDFAQMPGSRIDIKRVQDKFKDSLYVKKARMLADPTDDTLTLLLDLKKPAKLKVFQVPGEKTTSKVVLDLMS